MKFLGIQVCIEFSIKNYVHGLVWFEDLRYAWLRDPSHTKDRQEPVLKTWLVVMQLTRFYSD